MATTAAVAALAALTLLVAAQGARAEEVRVTARRDHVEMDNGLMALGFARGEEGIALTRLADTSRGVELLAPAKGDEIWRIEIGQGDEQVTLSSREGSGSLKARQTRTGAEAVLTWRLKAPGRGEFVVTVTVAMPRGRAETRWGLAMEARKPFPLWQVTFPMLPGLRAEGRRAALPWCWGIEWPEPLKKDAWTPTYPSATCAMQFVAVYDGQTGVYLGADDPKGCQKRFGVLPDAKRKAIQAQIVHYPTGMGQARQRCRLPYPVRVALVRDWLEAAKAYRRWALKAPWCREGALSARKSTPRWLKDVDVWALASGGPKEVVEPVKEFAEFMGVPTAVHWYNWHEIPFDTKYPEYFPSKPGFKKGVKALQEAGVRVMPYINGRLWDPATDSWAQENAEAACARKPDGEKYIEVYGSKVPLAVMCPQTSLWQEKVVGLVRRLTREVGVDGVYVDQISAAPSVLCFGKGHGHRPGGGAIWADGYRHLLEQARATLPRGAMLTTEEDADPWIDLLDAFLLVNTPPGAGEIIPLFPAVYSGRTITFGFQYIAGDDLEKGLPFRLKMARAFCFGSQLGWVPPQVVKHPTEAEYLGALAQCRRRAHKFLAYGELVGAPQVSGAKRLTVTGPSIFGGTYEVETPAVIVTAWRAEDGALGVAMTNMSDEAQEVDLTLGRAEYGLGEGRLTVREIGPEGMGRAQPEMGDPVRIQRRLEPRSAVVIAVAEGS